MSSKILGSLSPAYGLISGKGAFGKLADSGMAGVIPSLIAADRRKRKSGDKSGSAEPQSQTGRSMSDEDEKAAAQKFMSGARQMRTSPFGGGKSGIAIPMSGEGMKKGGSVSASKRADGIAKKGKTKGRMV